MEIVFLTVRHVIRIGLGGSPHQKSVSSSTSLASYPERGTPHEVGHDHLSSETTPDPEEIMKERSRWTSVLPPEDQNDWW